MQYIEIAYGNTDYLDEICRQFGYHGFKQALGHDKCNDGSPAQYPSYCGQACGLHSARRVPACVCGGRG